MAPTDPDTLDRYARAAGVAMLLSVIFGTLGELVLPGRLIVHANAAATAANVLAHPALVRVAFATYLVEGICDIALAVIFYILLAPVNRNLALIAAFFGIASMVLYGVSESSFYAASLILGDTASAAGMGAFTADQRAALAMLAIRASATIAGLFLALYGIASMLRGWLIFRSTYLPRWLGALLMIGGAGFFLRTATLLLTPSISSDVMLMPMALAGIPLTLWLLIRGVDVERLPVST
jgi:hypothetical protein